MNPFDMLATVIFAFCVIRGIFRGLIKEMSSIVGVLAGYYAAYSYYSEIAKLLSRWMTNSAYVNILSFLVIFCAVFFIVSILPQPVLSCSTASFQSENPPIPQFPALR